MQEKWIRVEGHPSACERAVWGDLGKCMVTNRQCGIDICCGLKTCCIEAPHDVYIKERPMRIVDTTRKELLSRIDWLQGFQTGIASTTNNIEAVNKLNQIQHDLVKTYHNMCGQGYIGCHGGEGCASDHK
jgi:hypothetical protein